MIMHSCKAFIAQQQSQLEVNHKLHFSQCITYQDFYKYMLTFWERPNSPISFPRRQKRKEKFTKIQFGGLMPYTNNLFQRIPSFRLHKNIVLTFLQTHSLCRHYFMFRYHSLVTGIEPALELHKHQILHITQLTQHFALSWLVSLQSNPTQRAPHLSQFFFFFFCQEKQEGIFF